MEEKLEEKELCVKVQMNADVLYDYYLYHTYRSAAGIIGTIVGLLLISNYVTTKQLLYLIFGIVVILYLPVNLYLTAKKQMLAVEAYKSPLEYRFAQDGLWVSQGETKQGRKWEEQMKAVSTSKSIIIYSSKNVATILPRESLGDDINEVIRYICSHMEPGKVKIRF